MFNTLNNTFSVKRNTKDLLRNYRNFAFQIRTSISNLTDPKTNLKAVFGGA